MEPLTPDELAAALDTGAVMLDTRPWELVLRDPLPEAVHAPLEQLQSGRMPDLSREADVIVVCEWGRKSELAGLYLEAHGFTRGRHLLGGVQQLRKTGQIRDARPGTEPR